MMTTLTISPYERKDRQALLNLMFYSRRTHTHLDWERPGTWLNRPDGPIVMAHEGEKLVGFLGFSGSLNGASWLRLGAIASHSDPGAILGSLWQALAPDLRAQGTHIAAALIVQPWLASYLTQLRFHHLEDVVTLHRNNQQSLPDAPNSVEIRPAYREDLPAIAAVDHAAFAPPWQLSMTDLWQAQRSAALATVAVLNDQVVGYQISTRHAEAGHLARLGVRSGVQGKGIGASLLHDLIVNLERRGVRGISVNTQMSNTRSQRLYERFGFRRNGFDLPVWVTELS